MKFQKYQMKDIHEALFKTYFGKTEVAGEMKGYVEKSLNESADSDFIQQIMTEIQPQIDAMKLGGHHNKHFEDRLFGQIQSYSDFADAVQDGHAASLFVDLTDFTARTFHENTHEVVKLKRGSIQIWMALALLNDGHIHSITGDGLMVLFPHNTADPVENAMRAYATGYNFLRSMDWINDYYNLTGKDRLRIKVGMDYCHDLVWNVCGLLTSSKECKAEVKATGFGVDFSAKLMNYTGPIVRSVSNIAHNEVLLFGESAKDVLSLNEDYYVEYKSKDGERPLAPYVRTREKETKNYRIFYSDTKKINRRLGKDFINFYDVPELLKPNAMEAVITLPPKSNDMYA